jgi:hypothetical protein
MNVKNKGEKETRKKVARLKVIGATHFETREGSTEANFRAGSHT